MTRRKSPSSLRETASKVKVEEMSIMGADFFSNLMWCLSRITLLKVRLCSSCFLVVVAIFFSDLVLYINYPLHNQEQKCVSQLQKSSVKRGRVSLFSVVCVCLSGREGSAEGCDGQDSDRAELHELGCGSAAARSTRSMFQSTDR